MNRIHPHVAGLAFLAAMLLAGCGKKEEAPPAAPQFTPTPAPPVVQAAKSAPEEDAGFQVIAILEGSTQTEIRARVSGFLIRQDFQEGASVKQGDLLFEIDARPFQAALEKAKANLSDKQAHAAPRVDLDAAQAAVTVAQADLASTKIVSPVTGMAGKAIPSLGDWIVPGTPVITISSADPIKAVFTLPKKFYEDHSERIAKVLALAPEARPDSLQLVLADGTAYSRKGRWDSMGTPVSASSGPVASALFPNPDHALRLGEYVKVIEGGQ